MVSVWLSSRPDHASTLRVYQPLSRIQTQIPPGKNNRETDIILPACTMVRTKKPEALFTKGRTTDVQLPVTKVCIHLTHNPETRAYVQDV